MFVGTVSCILVPLLVTLHTSFGQNCSDVANLIPSERTIIENGTLLRSPIVGSGSTLYPPDTTAEWFIQAPDGFNIYLEFVCHFELQGFFGVCNDYVEVVSSAVEFEAQYCGGKPAPLLISHNLAVIRFVSDGFVEHMGFVASISFISNDTSPIPEECSSTEILSYFKNEVYIRSPVVGTVDRKYPPNENSAWDINAPDGLHLYIEFICGFSIDGVEGIGCLDFLNITSNGFQRQFCGTTMPEPFIIESNTLSAVFQSNFVTEAYGFVMKVTFLNSGETETTANVITDSVLTTEYPDLVTTNDVMVETVQEQENTPFYDPVSPTTTAIVTDFDSTSASGDEVELNGTQTAKIINSSQSLASPDFDIRTPFVQQSTTTSSSRIPQVSLYISLGLLFLVVFSVG